MDTLKKIIRSVALVLNAITFLVFLVQFAGYAMDGLGVEAITSAFVALMAYVSVDAIRKAL